MEFIIRQLVVYPQKDQDAAGHTDGEAEQIGRGEGLVPEQVSPGYLEIVLEHAGAFIPDCRSKTVPLSFWPDIQKFTTRSQSRSVRL